MKEKKKHWWNKLKERWDSMDRIEKNFVIASVGSFISGAAIGGALCYNAATYEGHKKLIECANECTEMQKPLYVMCYATGVYDGQKKSGIA